MLSDHVDFGATYGEIERKLSVLLSDAKRESNLNQQAASPLKAFGKIETGDIRIWEQGRAGGTLRSGSVQHAHALEKDTYVLDSSLTTLHISSDELHLSSPTQDNTTVFGRFVPVGRSDWDQGEDRRYYFSEELQSMHLIEKRDKGMFWIRPGQEPLMLDALGSDYFFGEGFLLEAKRHKLTLFNARSAPLEFDPITMPDEAPGPRS